MLILRFFSHSLALIQPFSYNFNPFKQLWQPQSCFQIGETGGIKDYQQISQYDPYVKNTTDGRKTLTQTKTLLL